MKVGDTFYDLYYRTLPSLLGSVPPLVPSLPQHLPVFFTIVLPQKDYLLLYQDRYVWINESVNFFFDKKRHGWFRPKIPTQIKPNMDPQRDIFLGGALTMRLPFSGGPQKRNRRQNGFFLHSTVSANQATITSQIGLISHQMVSIEGTCVKYNENMYIYTNKG